MFATCCPKDKGKGKNGKGLDKGKGKGSGRYQGYGYKGACHYCGEVGYKRAECWKYWKDHQNQIRAVDEEEATEQVEGVEDHRRHPNLQSTIRTGRNKPRRGCEERAAQEERDKRIRGESWDKLSYEEKEGKQDADKQQHKKKCTVR